MSIDGCPDKEIHGCPDKEIHNARVLSQVWCLVGTSVWTSTQLANRTPKLVNFERDFGPGSEKAFSGKWRSRAVPEKSGCLAQNHGFQTQEGLRKP